MGDISSSFKVTFFNLLFVAWSTFDYCDSTFIVLGKSRPHLYLLFSEPSFCIGMKFEWIPNTIYQKKAQGDESGSHSHVDSVVWVWSVHNYKGHVKWNIGTRKTSLATLKSENKYNYVICRGNNQTKQRGRYTQIISVID